MKVVTTFPPLGARDEVFTEKAKNQSKDIIGRAIA